VAGALVASARELSAGLGQGLSEAAWLAWVAPGGRIAGTACAADREPKNASTRDVHTTGERRHAALDEFVALISGAWQESPRVVSASVCAIGDNRGPCLLWQWSLMLRDWRLRSRAP
jgi:hypothetical protein